MSERLTDEQLREWRDRRDPSGQPIHPEPVVPLIDDILALRTRVAKLEAALKEADNRNASLSAKLKEARAIISDVVSHLSAATSLLERGGKKAAPSDKMFEQMLVDYRSSLARGRAALKAAPQ